MQPYTIEMNQIVKRFGSVIANDHVNFAASSGEVHALLGENGAGKSTMMSILSGLYQADSGDIKLYGQRVKLRSPKDSMKAGIGMVYQNFRLVPTLTAIENMVLGETNHLFRGRAWLRQIGKEIDRLAHQYGLLFPLHRPIWQLSVGEQQRVEIVKALYRGADIIILDEPTSVLTPNEVEGLLQTLQQLKESGKTIVLTTHKLKEVMAAADRISVMRKGRMIQTLDAKETNENELARLMVGREVAFSLPSIRRTVQKPVLQMKKVEARADHGQKALNGLTLSVNGGEIVGIAGVAGNGQKELAEVLTGLRSWQKGKISYKGETLHPAASVKELINQGIAHIPENRMKSGLAGKLSLTDNLLLKSYDTKERSLFGVLRKQNNQAWAEKLVKQFDIKAPALETPVQQLSGGNQQKLLFAREADQQPVLMIAVHPTQGLDVGATEGVYEILLKLRNQGSGILLISEDLDEILHLSDRILVMSGGTINGEFERNKADKQQIGLLMAGITMEGRKSV